MQKQVNNKNVWKSASYLDPTWKYTPSTETDIRKTIKRYQAFLEQQKKS